MSKKIIGFIIAVIIIAVIVAVVVFANKGDNNTVESNGSAESTYSVKYDGVEIVPGTEFNADNIKKEAIFSEIPSCAFNGTDKVYTYDNAEITVATINGKDTVYSVYFIDDGIETSEGVKITDTKDKMIEKYGTEYKEELGNQFTYTKGNVELSFNVENDIVVGIVYTLITSE